MPPDPALTLHEALEGREAKPLCAPGESEAPVALAIAMLASVVAFIGLACAVMVWAT